MVPNIYIHPELQNVNLFGNGIFADAISDVKMRLGSNLITASPLNTREDPQIYTGKKAKGRWRQRL